MKMEIDREWFERRAKLEGDLEIGAGFFVFQESAMKICKDHWDVCHKAIDERGMSSLVANSGEAAMESLVADLQGQATNKDFDPLMSMHWHWTNSALRAGGLWTMEQDPSGKNDGHYCPICIYCEKEPGFIAEESVGKVADQMAEWARSEGLIPSVS